jgi:uncharacterized protein (TIGR02118 family)
MSQSLQVLYPVEKNSTFDFTYYGSAHMEIVGKTIGRHIERSLITRGLASGLDSGAGYHAVATITFSDKTAMDAALADIGPAVADIANFYSGTPQMLIGEVIG